MVEQGDYGPVLILRGRHQGKVGYYDDDDDGAIVYLGAPFSSDAVRLKHSSIQKIDAKSAELEKWKRRYPWLAKRSGCRERRARSWITPDERRGRSDTRGGRCGGGSRGATGDERETAR